MEKDLVSCIITTYKRDIRILERAINSVYSQTYRDIEVIVVNDNSEEDSLSCKIKELIQTKYEDILLVQHRKNSGACVARNNGVKVASGKYVAFLDDDDEWLPTKIEKQVSAFNKPEIVMVYCNRFVYKESTGDKHEVKNPGFTGKVCEQLLKDNFIGSTSYPMIKIDKFREVGGFDESLPALQDHDLWVRLSKIGEINYVPEPLVLFHVYPGERISNNPKKGIIGRLKLIENNYEYYEKHRNVLGFRYTTLAHYYAKDGQFGKAFMTWAKGVILNPLEIQNNIFELEHVIISIVKYKRK